MGTLGYRLHQERKERDQQGQGWKTEPRATREPGGESQPACQELCDIKVFISRLRGAAGAFKEGIDWVRYMLSQAPLVRVEGRHGQPTVQVRWLRFAPRRESQGEMVERDGNGAGSCEEACKHLEVYVLVASERINETIPKTVFF